jgi:hypothetical protein
MLKRLPAELRARHIEAIDSKTGEEAAEYLAGIIEKRELASRESHVSDPVLI